MDRAHWMLGAHGGAVHCLQDSQHWSLWAAPYSVLSRGVGHGGLGQPRRALVPVSGHSSEGEK